MPMDYKVNLLKVCVIQLLNRLSSEQKRELKNLRKPEGIILSGDSEELRGMNREG
jgi:hypothetical protein